MSSRNAKKKPASQSRPRPPILAIVLLVALTVTVLAVVTLRQLKSAEARRLRLLAGFSDRIESTVEDYTGHVVDVLGDIVPEGDTERQRFAYVKKEIDRRLGQLDPRYVEVRDLELPTTDGSHGTGGELESGSHAPEAAEIRLGADGLLGYITYRGPVPAKVQRLREQTAEARGGTPRASAGGGPVKASGAETNDSQTRRESETTPQQQQEPPPVHVEVTVAVELEPILSRIRLSNLFDSVIIAEPDGTVLVQQGEPELRTTTLLPLLEAGSPKALRLDLLLGGDEDTDKTLLVLENELPKALAGSDLDSLRRRIDVTTQVVETEIAGAPHTVFLQPVTVRLPRSEDQPVPQKLEWVACGVVSAERALSTSFTTSPLLLALLFAVFPLGLVLWPFLKLWLTSPRQPFSRFDLASLIFSSLLGLSLLVLVLLDLSFLFQLRCIEDEQLVALNRTVESAFLEETRDAFCTLTAASALLPAPNSGSESAKNDSGKDRAPIVGNWSEWQGWRTKRLAALGSPPEELLESLTVCVPAGEERDAVSGISPVKQALDRYRYFHAIFQIDDDGDQRHKIALRDSAQTLNRVEDRGYFQCARDGRAVTLVASPPEGPAPLPEAATPDGVVTPDRAALPQREPFELCLDSVLSKTSREALAVLSIRQPDDGPVTALTTQLLSFTEPLLPEGFGYAVLELDGRVLFHSDPRRNLIENFLKAADEDSLLRSLMTSRRAGLLSLTYWGRSHRAFARPLAGVPWTLVVFRDVQEPRLRNLEAVVGFLNPFLLYSSLVSLLAALLLALLPGRYLSQLWPHRRALPAYELIVWITISLTTLFALILADGSPPSVFLAALLIPVATLGFALCLLWWAGRPLARLDHTTGWRRRGRAILVLIAQTAAAVALARALWRTDAGDAWSPLWPLIFLGGAGLWTLATLAQRSLPDPLPRILAAGRWLPPALLLVAAGLLTPWLRAAPSVPLLALAVTALCAALVRWRHQFEGGKRRYAYLFTMTVVIGTLGIVATLGLFDIARERQMEFLVEDHQTGLVRALEGREKMFSRLETLTGRDQTADGESTAVTREPAAEAAEPAVPAGSETGGATAAGGAMPLYAGRPDVMLRVFFDTRHHPAGACPAPGRCEPPVAHASWARAGRHHGLGHDVWEGDEPGWWLTRIAGLFSARPVAVTDLTAGPLGVDLSRFDATRLHTARSEARLVASARSDYGTGNTWHLSSRLPPRSDSAAAARPPAGDGPARVTSRSVPGPAATPPAFRANGAPLGSPRLAVLGLLCLGVLIAPLVLGYLISHQALLVTLVPPTLGSRDHAAGDDGDGSGAEGDGRPDEEAAGANPEEETARPPADLGLLASLVVPQTREEVRAGVERAQPGTFDHLLKLLLANRGRPLRVLFVSSAPDLMLEGARRDPKFEVIEDEELEERAEELLYSTHSGKRAPVLVTTFNPELHDQRTGLRRLSLLRRLVEEDGGRSLVLVSMAEPGRLLGDSRQEAATSQLQDRWSSFLATFALQYGRDESGIDPVLMPWLLSRAIDVVGRDARLRPQAERLLLRRGAPTDAHPEGRPSVDLHRLRRVLRTDPALLVAGRDSLAPETRHHLDLLALLYRECCGTRHLQHLGRRVLDELPHKTDTPLTRQGLLSRIGYLARPYYRAIWSACDTDEKVTLYQMAEGGMANPKAYDRVLDLMERGLVIRDPALRLMNDSFARYVRTAVRRSQVLEWEGEAGASAWSVLKWLLPLPLLLLGGFLFLTQRDSFSNLVGFVVALGSIAPILANLYQYFEQVTARRAEAVGDEAAAAAARES